MKRFFAVILGMILLSSCGNSKKPTQQKIKNSCIKKDQYIAKKLQKKDVAALDFVHLQEAKMSDIPIPLSSQPITEYFDPAGTSVMLGYQDKHLSMTDVQEFYLCEMERLGWQIEEQFIGYETYLRFSRPPDRSCLISIRGNEAKESIKLVICSGAKSEFIT
jgi:hypothetical protein